MVSISRNSPIKHVFKKLQESKVGKFLQTNRTSIAVDSRVALAQAERLSRDLRPESLNQVLQQLERFNIEKRIFAAGENSTTYLEFKKIKTQITQLLALNELRKLGNNFFNEALFPLPECIKKAFSFTTLPPHFQKLLQELGYSNYALRTNETVVASSETALIQGDYLALRITEDILIRLKSLLAHSQNNINLASLIESLEKEFGLPSAELGNKSVTACYEEMNWYENHTHYFHKLNEFYLTASIALLKSLSNNAFHENLFPSHDCIKLDNRFSKRDRAVLQTIIDYLGRVSLELIDYESNLLISQKSGSIPYLIQKLKTS
jgi:hypothetical protein